MRRPGHGVPVHEHAELLGLPGLRHRAAGELLRGRRSDRRRLDALPAADRARRHARARLGHPADAAVARDLHRRVHDGRPELRHDGAASALPRHDAHAHAALGVGHFRRHHLGSARVPGVARGGHHDDSRPPDRHELLHAGAHVARRAQRDGRRQPGAVPASLLVLRSPRGVHRRAAGLRHRVGSLEHACAQEHLRLPHDGVGHHRYRRTVVHRVGASHVRQRHEPLLRVLLRHDDADHRDPDGDQGLQLGAHAVARRHPDQHPEPVCHRLHLHVRARRSHGPLSRQRDGRLAVVRHLFRDRSLPHGHGRVARHGAVRRDLPLVPEDQRQDAERALGPACTSG